MFSITHIAGRGLMFYLTDQPCLDFSWFGTEIIPNWNRISTKMTKMQIARWKPCTLTLVPRSRNQNRYHGTTGTAGTAASVPGLNWKICTVPTLIICIQSPLPFHKHDRIRVTQIYFNCDDIVLLFTPYFLAFLRTSIWPPAIVLRSSLWPFSWVSWNIDRKTVVVTFEHYLVNFNSRQCCSSQNFHHRTSYIYFFIAEN